MKVVEAAAKLNKSPEYIRMGLQTGRLPFGTAVKVSEHRWSYDIRDAAFEKYLKEGVNVGSMETN